MQINEKINVVIADFDKEFVKNLCDYMKESKKIEIVGCAYDGLEAVSLVKNNDVDVFIMDLVLPTIDGLGVLERLGRIQFEKRPHIIVVSSVLNEIGRASCRERV